MRTMDIQATLSQHQLLFTLQLRLHLHPRQFTLRTLYAPLLATVLSTKTSLPTHNLAHTITTNHHTMANPPQSNTSPFPNPVYPTATSSTHLLHQNLYTSTSTVVLSN